MCEFTVFENSKSENSIKRTVLYKIEKNEKPFSKIVKVKTVKRVDFSIRRL